MIKFNTKEKEEFTLLEFSLDGPIDPSELKDISIPEVDMKKGVIITGRGPVWLYGFLVHELHPCKWVATHDPRLGGVVVQSHTPGIKEGNLINLD